jgi:hypothetical protein
MVDDTCSLVILILRQRAQSSKDFVVFKSLGLPSLSQTSRLIQTFPWVSSSDWINRLKCLHAGARIGGGNKHSQSKASLTTAPKPQARVTTVTKSSASRSNISNTMAHRRQSAISIVRQKPFLFSSPFLYSVLLSSVTFPSQPDRRIQTSSYVPASSAPVTVLRYVLKSSITCICPDAGGTLFTHRRIIAFFPQSSANLSTVAPSSVHHESLSSAHSVSYIALMVIARDTPLNTDEVSCSFSLSPCPIMRIVRTTSILAFNLYRSAVIFSSTQAWILYSQGRLFTDYSYISKSPVTEEYPNKGHILCLAWCTLFFVVAQVSIREYPTFRYPSLPHSTSKPDSFKVASLFFGASLVSGEYPTCGYPSLPHSASKPDSFKVASLFFASQ